MLLDGVCNPNVDLLQIVLSFIDGERVNLGDAADESSLVVYGIFGFQISNIGCVIANNKLCVVC